MTRDALYVTSVVAFMVNAVFTFRFQRTTLGISRSLVGNANLQIALTPIWIGILGWLHTFALICLTTLLWYHYSWIFGIGFLALGTAGLALINAVSPVPSYHRCFDLESELMNRYATGDISANQLATQVAEIRKQQGH
jgi:hypothetical protein